MNSIVTGAMCEIQGRCLSGEQYSLIEQQAARIAELEADNRHYKQSLENYKRENQIAVDELAALRQRIADAPVVAWIWRREDGRTFVTTCNEGLGGEWKPLISKGDVL